MPVRPRKMSFSSLGLVLDFTGLYANPRTRYALLASWLFTLRISFFFVAVSFWTRPLMRMWVQTSRIVSGAPFVNMIFLFEPHRRCVVDIRFLTESKTSSSVRGSFFASFGRSIPAFAASVKRQPSVGSPVISQVLSSLMRCALLQRAAFWRSRSSSFDFFALIFPSGW